MSLHGKINTIKDALKHFEFKFSNVWDATPKDIEAYNKLGEFVEEKHNKQFVDNELFGKLYIIFYGQLLKFYKTTLYDPEPTKQLHKSLNQPLEVIIKKFLEIANDQEIFLNMQKVGLLSKHPILMTDKEKEKELSKFKIEMISKPNTYDEVKTNLTSLINFAIDEYS